MAHTYHQVLVHIVFSTKDRLNLIDPGMRDRLYAYMATVVKNEGYGHVLRINGPADHVHVLVDLAMTGAIADMVRTMKSTATARSARVARAASTCSVKLVRLSRPVIESCAASWTSRSASNLRSTAKRDALAAGIPQRVGPITRPLRRFWACGWSFVMNPR